MTTFDDYLKAGENCGNNNDFNGAIEYINKAIEAAVTNFDYSIAYGMRAGIYLQKGNRTQAIADLQMSADYGEGDTLEFAIKSLKDLGIDYIQKSDPVPPNFTGKGRYNCNDRSFGLCVYEGNWVNSKPHGKGKSTFLEGYNEGSVYEGDYIEGKKNTGKLIVKKGGFVYEGSFTDDRYHGKGKMTFSNGNVYEGDFKNGTGRGKGKMTYANGDVYEGDVDFFEPEGKGKMIYANSKVVEGKWKKGKKAFFG